MNSSFPITTWAVHADPDSRIDATFLTPEGLEFEKEIWEVLAEGGWRPLGISTEWPNDIVIEADPRIHVICKAIAGPCGWFDVIGRAFYRQYYEPDARTILAVPHAGAFFEKISYFCKKHDLHIATPNTLLDTVAALTEHGGTPKNGALKQPN